MTQYLYEANAIEISASFLHKQPDDAQIRVEIQQP
jgi:hypothetical protein